MNGNGFTNLYKAPFKIFLQISKYVVQSQYIFMKKSSEQTCKCFVLISCSMPDFKPTSDWSLAMWLFATSWSNKKIKSDLMTKSVSVSKLVQIYLLEMSRL